MGNGLNLLISRSLNEEIDINALEKIYNLKLPPIYKLFANSYILGEGKIFNDQILYKDKKFDLNFFSYQPFPDIVFSGFNDIEKVFQFYEYDDLWREKKYLPIGYCGFNGGILLGTENYESDQIILETVDLNPRFRIIASNIFEFMKGLTLLPSSYNNFDRTSIYKNWGEELWRLRENESE